MIEADRIHQDKSSLSNPHQIKTTHLQWDIKNVDFESKVLRATAKFTFLRVDPNASILSLDTAKLSIKAVIDQNEQSLKFNLQPENPEKEYLGRQLDITVPLSVTHVWIDYETTPASSALQWLPPSQTAGKIYPYLFTQCQAIHARSLLPCQDRPGVKITYKATVTVPSWSVCVMSAVQMIENISPRNEKTYVWMQDVPISSYLIAMAVGHLQRREISPRCAVWSEPAVVDIAAEEFSQTEEFLQIAESISGMPYVWGRYDLLCLPPSFPFGGMENPCLTFVTPTLLAGDKSLASVVAHEIAHSWTGNLVTNATWDHFWLNEGWTTLFERKIMARYHNDDRFLDFDAISGWKDLKDTCEDELMPDDFKKLVLDIGENDPDDSYSTVAYEKGFNLLMALERRVGKERFDLFFQAYVQNFSNQPLTSDDFREFVTNYFHGNDEIMNFDWETWFYKPGMPPEESYFDKSLALEAEELADAWLAVDRSGKATPNVDIISWTSNQKICFLDTLQTLASDPPLKVATIRLLDKEYGFAGSQNSEILFRYCQLAMSSQDDSMVHVVMKFATTQGRMKFTRPLYRSLFASPKWRANAKELFLENKDTYHPICAKMVASDLLQIEKDAAAKEESTVPSKKESFDSILPKRAIESLLKKENIESLFSTENMVFLGAVAVGLMATGLGMVLARKR